jgi:hypothetical protein
MGGNDAPKYEALELLAKHVTLDLIADALLVECSQLFLVVNINNLHGAIRSVCNVELKIEAIAEARYIKKHD